MKLSHTFARSAVLGVLTLAAFAASASAALPKLLDLGADRCIPCKMMAPILEELDEEYAGQLEVDFIDVWKNREAALKYDINSIPTQIFYAADGRELFRHAGFYSKAEILAKWKELGVELKAPAPKSESTPPASDKQ